MKHFHNLSYKEIAEALDVLRYQPQRGAAREEANPLDILYGPREKLPGLRAIVVREGEH